MQLQKAIQNIKSARRFLRTIPHVHESVHIRRAKEVSNSLFQNISILRKIEPKDWILRLAARATGARIRPVSTVCEFA